MWSPFWAPDEKSGPKNGIATHELQMDSGFEMGDFELVENHLQPDHFAKLENLKKSTWRGPFFAQPALKILAPENLISCRFRLIRGR